jgi:hypothetical protein
MFVVWVLIVCQLVLGQPGKCELHTDLICYKSEQDCKLAGADYITPAFCQPVSPPECSEVRHLS